MALEKLILQMLNDLEYVKITMLRMISKNIIILCIEKAMQLIWIQMLTGMLVLGPILRLLLLLRCSLACLWHVKRLKMDTQSGCLLSFFTVAA